MLEPVSNTGCGRKRAQASATVRQLLTDSRLRRGSGQRVGQLSIPHDPRGCQEETCRKNVSSPSGCGHLHTFPPCSPDSDCQARPPSISHQSLCLKLVESPLELWGHSREVKENHGNGGRKAKQRLSTQIPPSGWPASPLMP